MNVAESKKNDSRSESYEERLVECALISIQTMSLSGDKIEIFKILNGHVNIDKKYVFLT